MDKWEKALEELRSCCERLEGVVSGLSADQLDRTPPDGGWTPRQIVHHLADSVCIWGQFVRQALAGKGGEFSLRWYLEIPQDDWAQIWRYESRAIEPSLALYRSTLEGMASLLDGIGGLDAFQLEIKWNPEESEVIPVSEIVSFQAEHLEGHLKDIANILA